MATARLNNSARLAARLDLTSRVNGFDSKHKPSRSTRLTFSSRLKPRRVESTRVAARNFLTVSYRTLGRLSCSYSRGPCFIMFPVHVKAKIFYHVLRHKEAIVTTPLRCFLTFWQIHELAAAQTDSLARTSRPERLGLFAGLAQTTQLVNGSTRPKVPSRSHTSRLEARLKRRGSTFAISSYFWR